MGIRPTGRPLPLETLTEAGGWAACDRAIGRDPTSETECLEPFPRMAGVLQFRPDWHADLNPTW
jgi:hypothetical protein